jgi:nucleoside-diphosphate-sugar epimerase
MNILITSAETPFGQALAKHLSGSHKVRLTDLVDVDVEGDFVRCGLGHEGETEDLVVGMDVVVHLAKLPESLMGDEAEIDFQTRLTYNLLFAAREKKVPHVIFASSLRVFETCDENWNVTETWAPRPTPDAMVMGPYLGEFTCREFAREHSVRATCLRLGELGGEATDALAIEDAVVVIEKALAPSAKMWRVLHVQSEVPNARFPTAGMKAELFAE